MTEHPAQARRATRAAVCECDHPQVERDLDRIVWCSKCGHLIGSPAAAVVVGLVERVIAAEREEIAEAVVGLLAERDQAPRPFRGVDER
jgi:ribosomal protein L37AE/L43A